MRAELVRSTTDHLFLPWHTLVALDLPDCRREQELVRVQVAVREGVFFVIDVFHSLALMRNNLVSSVGKVWGLSHLFQHLRIVKVMFLLEAKVHDVRMLLHSP